MVYEGWSDLQRGKNGELGEQRENAVERGGKSQW